MEQLFNQKKLYLLVVIILLMFIREDCIRKNVNICRIITISILMGVLMVVSLNDKVFQFSGGNIELITVKDRLIATCGEDVYELAEEFQNLTDCTESFIGNPFSGSTGWIQLISRRNAYVSYKCVPSSTSGVEAWYQRICMLGGSNDGYGNLTLNDIFEIMNMEGIDYILVSEHEYEKYNRSEQFKILCGGQNMTCSIYKIIY